MLSLFVIACESYTEPYSETKHTIIDWVDFVMIDDIEYNAIYNAIIVDPKYIGDEIGQVQFKVNENITDPHYHIKDGDAAFWDKGTKIYSVIDMPKYIAIQDSNEINGYRIYQSQLNSESVQWHFKNVKQKTINKIDIYAGYDHPDFVVSIFDEQKIKKFMGILNDGKTNPSFSPDLSQGDSDIYHILFYTDQNLAHKYQLLFDGNVWYWHPWDTAILSDDIASFIIH